MTRLTEQWVRTIEADLPRYEREIIEKLGLDFAGFAARCGGVPADVVRQKAQSTLAMAVPISSGEGTIGGFAQAVAAILRGAGFSAEVACAADVDGLYQAHLRGAGLVFMADDDRYLGLNLANGCISDNNQATARAFVEALELLDGQPLAGQPVLVLGCGIVGRLAAAALKEKGALPVLFDADGAIMEAAAAQLGAECLTDPAAMAGYERILDATSTGGWLTKEQLHPQVRIAAPGVPLSLDEAALAQHHGRLVHDILHLGTLAMVGALCADR